MSEARFRDMNGGFAQFADVIYNNGAGLSVEQKTRCGYELLEAANYAYAERVLSAALTDAPADEDLHFGLALAHLGGVRPHRHSGATVQRVVQHLQAASRLPHARLLELLINEDKGLYWRRVRSKAIPPHIARLARQVPSDKARLILDHVPAPEARTWRAIASVTR